MIIHATYGDLIDEYVDREPLTGQAYRTNAAVVHTYFIKFTSGNPAVEAKLVPHAQKNNRRLDFIALKNHYKADIFHAINIVQSDKLLQNLFYVVKKNSHMWCDEFERQLKDAFNTYDCHERRNVHSDNQKLCILNRKDNAEILQDAKESTNLDLEKTLVTLNYDDAITAFRNQLNQKFPPELS